MKLNDACILEMFQSRWIIAYTLQVIIKKYPSPANVQDAQQYPNVSCRAEPLKKGYGAKR